MGKKILIRPRPNRQQPEIDLEKAETLISTAPSNTPENKLVEEVKQKSKPGPKPKQITEELQTYLLKYSKARHRRVKMAVLSTEDKDDIREWIDEAIEEKLQREGF